jgi:hypothetical protein
MTDQVSTFGELPQERVAPLHPPTVFDGFLQSSAPRERSAQSGMHFVGLVTRA